MNREIKFRGIHNDDWIYGYYVVDTEEHHRIYPYPFNAKQDTNYIVKPETVGQFTGLHDKNGKEIYEGDVIAIPAHYGGDYWFPSFDAMVTWEEDQWGIKPVSNKITCWGDWRWEECEIIGNIHENPELMEGGPQ